MRVVADEQDLLVAVDELAGAGTYYLDTEFDSSKHGKQLSLIQLSRGDESYVIDVLQLPSIEPLANALFHPDALWVLHAGLQDVELLLAELDRPAPPRLFDTQIAWGMTGPEASVSLAFLQFKLLGVRSTKSHQADDWLRRPLPEAQLAYAARDIAHLPALERALRERLSALGREHLVNDVSAELLLPRPVTPTPLGIDSFRNAWQLEAEGHAALLSLIDWYNALPEPERARTPAKTLLSVASRMPPTVKELSRIKGVSPQLARSHGPAIVALVKQAARAARTGTFAALEPQAYASFEDYRAEARLNLARIEVCAELSIAPDLALPMGLVRRMLARIKANGRLSTGAEELTGWRAELVKPTFLAHAARLDAYARGPLR